MIESGMSYLVGFASKSAGSALAPREGSGQETVARVAGVRSGLDGNPRDLHRVQVVADWMPGCSDLVGLVSLQHVFAIAVLVGKTATVRAPN